MIRKEFYNDKNSYIYVNLNKQLYSKNDLPSYKYGYFIRWYSNKYEHRDNDLPYYICHNTYGKVISYTYCKFNTRYKYNGYVNTSSYTTVNRSQRDNIIDKFIKGINLKKLKESL